MTTSTTDPLARLTADHRHIEDRAARLDRAAAALDAGDRDAGAAAIAEVLAYFDGPGAVHHAHEEHTLFPALRPLEAFAQMIPAFEMQHRMNDETHAQLRAALSAGSDAALADLARRFAEMQRAHIVAEERALFPLIARELGADALAALGREMAARAAQVP